MASVRKSKSRTIEELIQALKDSDWEVRYDAVKALRKLKDPRSIKPLTQVLHDSDADIKEEAANTLKEITGQEYTFDSPSTPISKYDQILAKEAQVLESSKDKYSWLYAQRGQGKE